MSREGVCCVPVFWEKGQCTQLCSGGKCKTNMPHTCSPPPPPSAVKALLSKMHPSYHTPHCASPFIHFHRVHQPKAAPSKAQPRQEGFLINTEPCGGLYVRMDGTVCASLRFPEIVPLQKNKTKTMALLRFTELFFFQHGLKHDVELGTYINSIMF